MSRKHSFPTLQKEDASNWHELPRTDEIKTYSRAVMQLVRRSIPMRFASLLVGGYITWLIVQIVGIAGVGPTVNDGERRIALLVSIGWFGFMFFFVIPVVAMVYRGRWFRVSAKDVKGS